MTFQFIWQGCDSLLAAPLVLDLVRFTERAWRAGQTGPMTFLSSFFKSPLAVEENDFSRQFQNLEAWAAALCQAKSARRCGDLWVVAGYWQAAFRGLNRPRGTRRFLLRFPPRLPPCYHDAEQAWQVRTHAGGATADAR